MLKVDHQSGGFTPWNEICPKKYLSLSIPVDPLWQNCCNLSCAIPLGRFAPCFFAMSYVYPVKLRSKGSKRTYFTGVLPAPGQCSWRFFYVYSC